MPQRLTERIAERMRSLSIDRGLSNGAVLLALRDEIAEAIESGWTQKAVWETLYDEGRITCGYDSFRAHLRRILRPRMQRAARGSPLPPRAERVEDRPLALPTAAAREESAVSGPARDERAPAQLKGNTLEGFRFDPNPKDEDLF